jgi:hypothetical protein
MGIILSPNIFIRAQYLIIFVSRGIKIFLAYNTKNFLMKFCTLIVYIIDYVQIYFYKFLKLTNMSQKTLSTSKVRPTEAPDMTKPVENIHHSTARMD